MKPCFPLLGLVFVFVSDGHAVRRTHRIQDKGFLTRRARCPTTSSERTLPRHQAIGGTDDRLPSREVLSWNGRPSDEAGKFHLSQPISLLGTLSDVLSSCCPGKLQLEYQSTTMQCPL